MEKNTILKNNNTSINSVPHTHICEPIFTPPCVFVFDCMVYILCSKSYRYPKILSPSRGALVLILADRTGQVCFDLIRDTIDRVERFYL